MTIYVFDVDGTLTPPRQLMDFAFKDWFLNWSKGKRVFIVTGANSRKAFDQLGIPFINRLESAFFCSGNHVYDPYGADIVHSRFDYPEELIDDLAEIRENHEWVERYDNPIEHRTGMINFSIIGRDAPSDARARFNKANKQHGWLEKIAMMLRLKYTGIDFVVGGEISIDIFEAGRDKSQIVRGIPNKENEEIIFFGDKIHPGGNDWSLAQCKEVTAVPVTGWKDTWSKLRDL